MAKVALICMYDNWALGLRTMANALKSHGHEVSIIHFKMPSVEKRDFFMRHPLNYENLNTQESRSEVIINSYNIDVNMWTKNEILLLGDLLEDLQPDLIGLSTRSVYEEFMSQVLEQMQRITGAITLAGGHDATFRPELYLDLMDFVCQGEGEAALLHLARVVDQGGEKKSINNLVYKENGKLVYNPLAPPVDSQDYFFGEEMDQVAHYVIEENACRRTDFLLRDVSFSPYTNDVDYYTMAGRGCPGKCTFCSAGQFQWLYNEEKVLVKARRNRPLKNILAELKFAREKGFRKIFFMDSFLLAERRYLLEFFEAYRQEIGMPFFAQLYPEQVLACPEILTAACRAGMVHTVVGLQGGSDRINRDVFRRKTSLAKLREFAEMLTGQENLEVDYHLITHNPFETDGDVQETLELLRQLPKRGTHLVLQRLRPFPNTAIDRLIPEVPFPESRQDTHDRRFLLYLLRYVAADTEFDRLWSRFDELSFDDLKRAYKDLRSSYRDSTGWADQGWKLYHDRDFSGAIAAFQRALNLDSQVWRALEGLGWAYFQKHQYRRAEKYFSDTLKGLPAYEKNAWQETLRGLGWTLYHRGRYAKAVACFNQALEHTDFLARPILKELYTGMGWANCRLGRWAEAKAALSRAGEYSAEEDQALADKLAYVEKNLHRARSNPGNPGPNREGKFGNWLALAKSRCLRFIKVIKFS
ncbi:MAG: tetratricopeptide repeat protein [Thermodesulfobacteriota bacterium]